MIRPMYRVIDRFLYKRRFQTQTVRHLLSVQIVLCITATAVGVLALYFTSWPLVFSAGVALAVFNFWHIARFAGLHLQRNFSPAMAFKYFFFFMMRLILTALAIFVLIVWLQAPLVPLLAGLASVITGIFVWILLKVSASQAKEV